MARSCSKRRRCIAHLQGILLTDDNFRKGTYPPQSLQFWRQCSFCRQTRTIALRHDPSRVCSKCQKGQPLDLFTGSPLFLFPLTVGGEYNMCRLCCSSASQSVMRGQRQAEQYDVPVNNPVREPRIRRPPRHYDSSPDMDQPLNCERVARNPNHPITFLRDFIDEVDGRRRPVCNVCRRQLEPTNDVTRPLRRLRENGYSI